MPDLSTRYTLSRKLRRYPHVYGPARATRDFFAYKIPRVVNGALRVMSPERAVRLGPPRGLYSIYSEKDRSIAAPGRIVLSDQGKLNAAPDSLLVRSNLKQHCTQPWPIFWSRHQNARLVSSSLALLDEKKRLCREAAYREAYVDDPAWNYTRLPKETYLRGKWTSLVSRWCPGNEVALFSHWVLDALPRLALVPEFPQDTQILVPFKLAGYQKEMLKMLGLLDRVRCTPESHVVVEDYYFSAPTAMISTYSPYGIDFLRSKFLPLADKSYTGPKRFIIQRKGKTRGIRNNDEVNAFFQSLGWGIINTEDLTFAQELELFKNAEAIGGVMGSGFTNAIWSSPGCKVFMFVPENRLDGWAEWICNVNQLPFYWKLFPSDHEEMITVDLGEVKKVLAETGLLS